MSERHTFVTGFAYDKAALGELFRVLRHNRVDAHMLCPDVSTDAHYISGFFRTMIPGELDAQLDFADALETIDWSKMPHFGLMVSIVVDGCSKAVSGLLTPNGLVWLDDAKEQAA